MSKNLRNYDWNTSKTIDDVASDEGDEKLFQSLLNRETSDPKKSSPSPYLLVGQILPGKIVELHPDFVTIDVGLKSEGLVPIDEFDDPSEIEIGKEVEIYLEKSEAENGQISLSREKARRQRKWEYIANHCEEGSIVTGKATRKVKGGLIVDIGIEAFLPGSQIDDKPIKDIDDYLNREFSFKILKINRDRKNIIVSRREILEEEKNLKKGEILQSIQEGETRTGIVKNITEFGVFVDLGGLDGLLHITDMSWKRIRHPSAMVHLGQEIEVVVLQIDREKGRISLGIKQKEANPWEEIERKYPPGTRVRGRVVNITNYGAFIEIEPGIEGLVHISEMSWTKSLTHPSEMLSKGEEREVVVLSVQKEEGKISLGIKQTEENPWEEVEEKYPLGTIVKVEVSSIASYGVFVQIVPGITGLIHISDMSWTRKISHPSELLKKGEQIDARILSIDRESKKIALGIKQLTPNPWDSIDKITPVDSIVTGKVRKVTAFGAFVELEGGIEGFVHADELSATPFKKVGEVVSTGDEIRAKILKIDPEGKKITLSMKACSVAGDRVRQDEIAVLDEIPLDDPPMREGDGGKIERDE